MRRQFDLLIFDWDGTLVDSIDWIVRCLREAAEESGCTVPNNDAARAIIGLSIERAMNTLFPGIDAATQEQLIRAYSRKFFTKTFTRDDLFDGVYDLLGLCKKKGYRLAVATGKKNAGLLKAMAGTGVGGFFDITRSADQTASKPNPRMINEIVEQMGVDKNRVVMVGDSIHDLQMAKNAGVAAIAVGCGAHGEADLKRYEPMLCLTQTGALVTLV